MDDTSIQMIREDLTEDFHALDDVHTKSIRRLLEEFNDDQMLLMIETEHTFNDNAPTQLDAVNDQQIQSDNHTPSDPTLQSNDRTELAIEISAKQTNAPRPNPATIPRDDTAETKQAEGILDILPED